MLRMDFLLESEKRYQGPVSGPFLVSMTSLTLLALLALATAHQVYQYRTAAREVSLRQAAEEAMRPRIQRLHAQQAVSGRLRRAYEELDGWASVRVDWSEVLRDVGKATPPTVQWAQADVRDELVAPRSGAATQATPVPRRRLRFRLTGLVTGEDAEAVVSRLIQELREILREGEPVFPSVTLLSIQAERSDGPPVGRFELEGTGPERVLP